MSTEVVGLPVAPLPFLVPVGLVAGNEHANLDPGPFADAFEQVDHAHCVGLEGSHGVEVRLEYEGLSGQMEDHVGPDLVEYVGQTASVAFVA